MRAFLAITLPAEIREALASLQRQLAESRADVTWVEPENLHVTLKFLDEITEEQCVAVEALLRRVAAEERPFTLGMERVGAFPSVDAPRVLWVGVGEGKTPLVRIAEAVEREGAALALRAEERPFAAHVTVGRVRSSRNRPALAQRLHEVVWQAPPPWRVAALTLYQSQLTSSGSQYRVLADVPLG